MRCPYCRGGDSRVLDSRTADDGAAIRRRRECQECGKRFTTAETAVLSVSKRSGATEPFSRAKVVSGVRKACQGRPVSDDDLALLAQRVEDALRATGSAEIPAEEVGIAILGPLRELDEVAYSGGAIDVGEAVAQTLALALDPYPRAPNADAALQAAGITDEADLGPFAALKGLLGKGE